MPRYLRMRLSLYLPIASAAACLAGCTGAAGDAGDARSQGADSLPWGDAAQVPADAGAETDTGPSLRPTDLRGTNIAGMELSYLAFDQDIGPVAGTHYPVHDTRLFDYLASKDMSVFRFLFSWEGMQAELMGPIPASSAGNYRAYFDHYKRIVDYATHELHIQVIIEPWQANSRGGVGGARWKGELVGSDSVPREAFSDFWSKMATHFADNPRVEFGLVNEPNNMSTLSWFASAQAAIEAIRSAGAAQRIHVPGNGYSAASGWTSDWYDTATPRHSNAYGWLNAGGTGIQLTDPENNLVAEVHTYLDPDQGGGGAEISSMTAASDQISDTVNEARANGYSVFLGEIGFWADHPLAYSAWENFIRFTRTNSDVFTGYAWWAAGDPLWWNDVAANGGQHFSISPTDQATFTGDTVNMDMIENDF